MLSLKTIGLVLFLFIIILFFAHKASRKEGLETMDTTATVTTAPTLVPAGEAGGAAAYAAAVKLNMTKMQDALLVKKYKKD